MRTGGWRPRPLTLSSVGEGTLVPGETTVTLPLEVFRAAEPILDASGQAALRIAALPPAEFDVTLPLGGDGKRRLCSAVPPEAVLTATGTEESDPSLF